MLLIILFCFPRLFSKFFQGMFFLSNIHACGFFAVVDPLPRR